MQAQDKYMNATFSSACGGLIYCKFNSAKKNSADRKDPNTLVAYVMAKALKIK